MYCGVTAADWGQELMMISRRELFRGNDERRYCARRKRIVLAALMRAICGNGTSQVYWACAYGRHRAASIFRAGAAS